MEIAQPGPLTDPWSLLFNDVPLPGVDPEAGGLQTIGPWPDRITGRVTLMICAKATVGPVDIKIEALVHNFYSSLPDRIYRAMEDGSLADLSILVPSTRTLIGDDNMQCLHVQAPAVDLPGMYVRVTGIGENGADTLVSCSYMFGNYST